MFARHDRMMGALYGCADLVLSLVSFFIAYEIRFHLTRLRALFPLANYSWLVPATGVIPLGVGVVLGIYRDIREEDLQRAFMDPLKVAAASATLIFAMTFAFHAVYISRLLIVFYGAADLAAMTGFRLLARRFAGPLRRSVAGVRTFLIVGDLAEMTNVAREIQANESRGMTLFGIVHVNRNSAGVSASNQGSIEKPYPEFSLERFPDLLRRDVIDEVIFAVSKEALEKLEDIFVMCEVEGVRTRLLLNFFPHTISRVSLERMGDKPVLTFSTTPESESLLLLKRAFDFALALLLLVILSPLLLLLAVFIKVTSRGPVLFRQVRCGLGGRKFNLYKFRSMREEADLHREELEALNEMDGPVFKIRNDPRCTPLGRMLRRHSLDELPQLFNVLKGDMSLVGPRPPLPEEVEKYEPWQRRRLRMRPGLTCLWALEGRSRITFRRWMELDLEYIDNWSPALDWKILLKTIPVVLLGRGAF